MRYAKSYMASRRRDSRRSTKLKARLLHLKVLIKFYIKTGKKRRVARKGWHGLKS